jgi:phosphate transport system protein
MTQLENELESVKSELVSMWTLVQSQLSKSMDAMLRFDKDLAREVLQKEKRVNATELKIDMDCENVFALYCPVAVDLRFLLAVLKINNNLERIGDIAEGIAKYIIESPTHFDNKIIERTELLRMYEDSINILSDTRTAFEKEDTVLARSVFKRDEILDQINRRVNENVASLIKEDMSIINEALYVASIIRKLERVGDQSKNIAEEIIFYLEAKVLKHQEETEKNT